MVVAMAGISWIQLPRQGDGWLLRQQACHRHVANCFNEVIFRRLFDHFIGECQEIGREGEPECLCGLEVEHKVEFGRLLDRQL